MKRTLVLLTKTYPFGKGEQYITAELPALSQAFEKIVIYPNDYYSNSSTHDKALPANVEVLNFNTVLAHGSPRSFLDYLYLLRMTLGEFFATDDKTYFFKNFKWSLVNFWTQLKLANHFVVYMKEQGITHSNTIFYSYWFHKSAIFLSVLKNKGHINAYISRAHSVDLYHNDWGIINDDCMVPPFKMFKLKYVTKLCPVSEHGYLYLKKKFPVHTNAFDRKYLGVQAPLQLHKEPSEAFHIITCSGFDYNKRVHKLAEALMHIRKPVRWTHFGTGEMEQQVVELVKQFPANIHADFKGQQPNNKVKNFYATHQVDLFVNLSIVEGLPVSIMEAMSCGIPALATAVYGTPEAVIEGKTGFLISPDFSVEQLAQKIGYCIDHRNELAQMGENARCLYFDIFSAEKNYTEFATFLTTL